MSWRRVFVVLDSHDRRSGVAALLAGEADLDVVAMGGGTSAVAWLRAERPALVVVDLDARVADRSLIETLRLYPELARVPILAIGREGLAADMKARALGCAGFVAEPLVAEQLRQAVVACLAAPAGVRADASA